MKRITAILAAVCCLLSLSSTMASAQNKSDNYNLTRAYEAYEEDDDDAALDFLEAHLEKTPKDPRALLLRARIEYRHDKYGAALTDLADAEKHNNSKRSDVYGSTIFMWRYMVYDAMGEDQKALAEIEKAHVACMKEKRSQEDIQMIRFDLANEYYQHDRIDDAEAIYQMMLRDDESDSAALIGLARNALARKNGKAAVTFCEKAQKLTPDYPSVYKYLARSYEAVGEQKKAIDAGLDFLRKDSDFEYQMVLRMMTKKPVYAESQVKSRLKDDDWLGYKILLCRFYDEMKNYVAEVDLFSEIIAEYGEDSRMFVARADALLNMGFVDYAMEDNEKAVELDRCSSTLAELGYCQRCAGDYDTAIESFSEAIELDPSSGYLHYFRGWLYELTGDDRMALCEYETGCELEEDYYYTFLKRGEQYLKKGETQKAKADFEYCVQRDTVLSTTNTIYYALHLLGRDEEALEWMDRIIEADPEDAGNWYDRACLLSRIGHREDAVAAFRTAIDKGFRKYHQACTDSDLAALRRMRSFCLELKRLEGIIVSEMEKYDAAHSQQSAPKDETISEVQMRKTSGGTYEVPCAINGLALNMIFDTGASDVTISSVEAGFMLKNGYLKEKDIKGSRSYMTASGDVKAGTVIRLREVKLGDSVLKDIEASVVHNQKAPLLLGQSVLEKFGTITVDNNNSKLIIKK